MTVTNGNAPNANDFDAELQAALDNAFIDRGGNGPDSGEEKPTASSPPPSNTEDDGDLTQLPGYDPDVPTTERPDIPESVDELLGGDGDGEDGGDGGDDGPSIPTAPITEQQFVDLNKIAEQFYGNRLTEDQATALFQIANDLSMLDEEKRERLSEVLYGNAQPAPQPQTPPAPSTSTQGYDYSPDDVLKEIEEDYPEVAKALRTQQQLTQQQLSELTSWKQQFEAQQAQIQMAQYQKAVTNASTEWRKAHPEITPEEFVAISTRGGAGQYAQILVQQGHDPETAVKMALDTAILTDPTLKQKAIDAEVERRSKEVTQTLDKKRKAAALTGSGGPATHEPPKLNPKDAEGRRAAMKNEVLRFQSEGITTPPAS